MFILYRLTGVEHIAASLVAFSRLSRVYFCKATALLQIARLAFRKKAAKISSSTLQIKNFLYDDVEERRNTGVFQVIRRSQAENYYL